MNKTAQEARQIAEIYKQWCKETKRNGGVLIGKSIQEFFEYYLTRFDAHKWVWVNCKAVYAEYVNGCPKCATGEPGGSHKVVPMVDAPTAGDGEECVDTWIYREAHRHYNNIDNADKLMGAFANGVRSYVEYLQGQTAPPNAAGDNLRYALENLVKDIRRKPNDTRYATALKIADEALALPSPPTATAEQDKK